MISTHLLENLRLLHSHKPQTRGGVFCLWGVCVTNGVCKCVCICSHSRSVPYHANISNTEYPIFGLLSEHRSPSLPFLYHTHIEDFSPTTSMASSHTAFNIIHCSSSKKFHSVVFHSRHFLNFALRILGWPTNPRTGLRDEIQIFGQK